MIIMIMIITTNAYTQQWVSNTIQISASERQCKQTNKKMMMKYTEVRRWKLQNLKTDKI